jgi:CHASE3 domain sensor protein
MPDTFIKNNMSIVVSFLVAVFTAGGIFAEFTAIKNELTTVHERLDKKIRVINDLEDRILDMEKQLEYERGFLDAAKKKKK